jgi:hypothetical protein
VKAARAELYVKMNETAAFGGFDWARLSRLAGHFRGPMASRPVNRSISRQAA